MSKHQTPRPLTKSPTELLGEAIDDNDYKKAEHALENKAVIQAGYFNRAVDHYLKGLKRPVRYDYRILELLARNNANVNEADADTYTPLHIAAKLFSPGLIEFLLRNNAKYDIPWKFEEPKTAEGILSAKGKEEWFRNLKSEIEISSSSSKPTTWEYPISEVIAHQKKFYPVIDFSRNFTLTISPSPSHWFEKMDITFSCFPATKESIEPIWEFYTLKSSSSFADVYEVLSITHNTRGDSDIFVFTIRMKDTAYNKKTFAQHTEELFDNAASVLRQQDKSLDKLFVMQQNCKEALATASIYIKTVQEKLKPKLVRTAEFCLLMAMRPIENETKTADSKDQSLVGALLPLMPEIMKMWSTNGDLTNFVSDEKDLSKMTNHSTLQNFFILPKTETVQDPPTKMQALSSALTVNPLHTLDS